MEAVGAFERAGAFERVGAFLRGEGVRGPAVDDFDDLVEAVRGDAVDGDEADAERGDVTVRGR
ncbi:hypothetical protein [Demequina sediminicola]|uniref:hypothetical protein n=1 Tax=Demequina sediminicola TaxID=1095026 RepID=UPI0007827DA3|nr:hypothetical protein [Demequina sediminicola]